MEIKHLQVGPIGTNCYLLADEEAKQCAVIDPGDYGAGVAREVSASGYALTAIFLTHGHYDHTGGVEALLKEFPDAPVYLSRKDQYPGDAYLQQLFPPIPGCRDYGEGDTIMVGDLAVKVLHTPGHSEGCVVLQCEDVLFTGDTLFAGSMGRTDFPGGSTKKIMKSLKRLAELEGNFAVLPGHMETSNLETERQRNPYMIQAMRY